MDAEPAASGWGIGRLRRHERRLTRWGCDMLATRLSKAIKNNGKKGKVSQVVWSPHAEFPIY